MVVNNQSMSLLHNFMYQKKPVLAYANEKIMEEVIDIVDCFVENGADINLMDNYAGRAPLVAAVEFGDIYFVDRLLNEGANIHTVTSYGENVLQAAILRGDEHSIPLYEKFIADGVRPCELVLNDVPCNMLITAAAFCRIHFFELLSQSIDINSQNSAGITPLIAAIYASDEIPIHIRAWNSNDYSSWSGRGACR